MQTFLPYPNFVRSAACLDRQRLGKQRVEVLQILRALSRGGAWANHPAVQAWARNRQALVVYGTAVCLEWKRRGYRDSCLAKIQRFSSGERRVALPRWLGDPAFHRAHRSNLLRKDPEYYGRFWSDPADLPYLWPTWSPEGRWLGCFSLEKRKELLALSRR